MSLLRQISTYALVGVVATLAHYAVLVSLVEGFRQAAVPAALAGYVIGGIVSYVLNRRHTFASDRPHRQATWRFALVAFLGFCLTYAFMHIFVDNYEAPYLPAQMLATVLIMFVTYVINRQWTFRAAARR
jgi:putative flippase GtrA